MKKKYGLVIFVNSVSGRFRPGPSSLEFKYVRIVAGFAYAMKENIKIKAVVCVLKTKRIGNVFSLHGCQDNEAFVKYSNGKEKRPLKFCI